MGCIIVVLVATLVTVIFGPATLLIVGTLGGVVTGLMIITAATARGGAAIRREAAERLQASGYEVEVGHRRASDTAPPAERRRKPFFADPATACVAIAAALAIWLFVWLLQGR